MSKKKVFNKKGDMSKEMFLPLEVEAVEYAVTKDTKNFAQRAIAKGLARLATPEEIESFAQTGGNISLEDDEVFIVVEKNRIANLGLRMVFETEVNSVTNN